MKTMNNIEEMRKFSTFGDFVEYELIEMVKSGYYESVEVMEEEGIESWFEVNFSYRFAAVFERFSMDIIELAIDKQSDLGPFTSLYSCYYWAILQVIDDLEIDLNELWEQYHSELEVQEEF